MFTLSPARFQIIRRSLGNASGLESPGYNQLLAAAEAAEAALGRLLARRDATLLDVYQDPEAHPDLHRIAERFVDWDGTFQSWLVEHFMLVRRTIGIDKSVRALDGFPTVALGARMTKPLFSDLWAVRVEMTRGWTRDGGFVPGRGARAPDRAARRRAAGTADVDPAATPVELRSQFPLLETCVYLNSNATGATPRAAKAALDDVLATPSSPGATRYGSAGGVELHAHADELAALIGGTAGSVVCDTNVSTLVARVMSCFDYRARPRVVTSDLEFPTIPHLLRAFERYGVVPMIVPSHDDVTIDVEAVVRAIDERTQLVMPLARDVHDRRAPRRRADRPARAREVGALVALDAYQSVGVVPIDVDALDVDFLLAGAHKWLCGSYESAFLYVRPALLPQPATGGDRLDRRPPSRCRSQRRPEWAEGARRFAGGTPGGPADPVLPPRPRDHPRTSGVDDDPLPVARAGPIASSRAPTRRSSRSPRHARTLAAAASSPCGSPATTRSRARWSRATSCAAIAARCGSRPHFYNTDDEVDRFMDALIRCAREAP